MSSYLVMLAEAGILTIRWVGGMTSYLVVLAEAGF